MSMSILRVCSFRRAVTSLSNGITSGNRPSSNRARGAVSVSARRWLGTTQPLPEGEDSGGSPSPCLPIQRVCVVGSGPSGFYTTKYLLENADKDARSVDIRVDMMEKLPTPFGLVRYGVAPDHPEVKIVADQFSEVAKNPRFRFFGNVTVGEAGVEGEQGRQEISVQELLQRGYDAVVLAYGAESNRQLGIPGEQLGGVFSAREFVNWYNGHPDFVHVGDAIDLSKTKSVVVVGQGNVALDCARLLAKPISDLQTSDLTDAALQKLASSTVKDIHVAGRRGHIQAAFTIKELRELTKIPGVHLKIFDSELQAGMTPSSEEELRTKRPLKRITDLITTTAAASPPATNEVDKTINIRFFLSPVECIEGVVDGQRTGTVSSVVFEKCILEGPPHAQRAVSTGDTEEIPCDLLLSAVGYKSLPLPGVPFDTRSNTIPHVEGRVLQTFSMDPGNKDEDLRYVAGLYVSGWCKRGPVGIVGSNITDAKETVRSVLADLADAQSERSAQKKHDHHDPAKWLAHLHQSWRRPIVSWQDHLILDEEERRRGQASHPLPKPREKVTDVKEMLSVVAEKGN